MSGESYGPYRVLRKLGAGGMGEVFLAEHELIGRKAAIKVLHAERSARRESVDRFFNEARAAAVISDPGIVQIYDFGFTAQGTAYIVMESLEGEPLSDRLHRLGALPIVEALRIVRQTAGSLAAAHAAGIVHRDLKPDNLFMVRDPETAGGERPKILDFGIAKLEGDNNRFKTRTGAVMGTPVYMSPEQCNDSGKIDHRSDIYSLGCVLFHLIAGKPPFDYAGVGALISAHMTEVPRAPSTVLPHLPTLVDQIVLRCLEKDPAARFASMIELQQACDHAMSESARWTPMPSILQPTTTLEPVASTTLGHSVGQTSPPQGSSKKGLVLGLAALVVLVGVGITAVVMGGTGDTAGTQPAENPEPLRSDPPPPPEQPHADAATVRPADAAAAPVAPPADAAETPVAAPDATPAKPPIRPRPRPRPQPQPTNDLYDDRN